MQEKTYKIELNEEEAEVLKTHIDGAANELDNDLRQNKVEEGWLKEEFIFHIDTLEKISKQLPKKV
jgi:hypothetical protein